MPHSGKNSCVVFVRNASYWSYPYLNFLRFFRAKKKNAFQQKKKKFSEASIAFFISPTFLIHERYENYKQHRSKTKQLTYLSHPFPHKFNFSKTQSAQQAQQAQQTQKNTRCHTIT